MNYTILHKPSNADNPAAWNDESFYFGQTPSVTTANAPADATATPSLWDQITSGISKLASSLTPTIERAAQVSLAQKLLPGQPVAISPDISKPMLVQKPATGIFSSANMPFLLAGGGLLVFMMTRKKGRR